MAMAITPLALNAQGNYIVNSLGDAPAVNPAAGTGLTAAGDITLRSAMMAANADGVPSSIEFSGALYSAGPVEILAGTTLPSVTTPLFIFGPGAETLTVRTNGARVFVFQNGAQGILWGMTITGSTQGAVLNSNAELRIIECVLRDNNGGATGLGGGGAVDNRNGGQLLLRDSTIGPGNSADYSGALDNFIGTNNLIRAINTTFIGNQAVDAGGVLYNGGASNLAQFFNCTFSQNTAGQDGGVLYQEGAGLGLVLINCTMTNNSAGRLCGGIYSFQSADIFLVNTIAALNTEDGGVQVNIDGNVSPASNHNFIGENRWLLGITNGTNGNQIGTAAAPINPQLLAIGDNGGFVPTRLPAEGSPVINTGTTTIPQQLVDYMVSTDARGLARLSGPAVDIGAVEVQVAVPSVPGDFDGDGIVNVADVTALARHIEFGASITGDADYNGDSSVDQQDVEDLARDIADGVVAVP
jgi:hypothetical protein